mmetsp:Transcript_35854/g.114874  ORF Transcript_35854/g.114874 Transcript_35854/m.114874 type:complete len:252 (-) Transcript_35854:183-938(-)
MLAVDVIDGGITGRAMGNGQRAKGREGRDNTRDFFFFFFFFSKKEELVGVEHGVVVAYVVCSAAAAPAGALAVPGEAGGALAHFAELGLDLCFLVVFVLASFAGELGELDGALVVVEELGADGDDEGGNLRLEGGDELVVRELALRFHVGEDVLGEAPRQREGVLQGGPLLGRFVVAEGDDRLLQEAREVAASSFRLRRRLHLLRDVLLLGLDGDLDGLRGRRVGPSERRRRDLEGLFLAAFLWPGVLEGI